MATGHYFRAPKKWTLEREEAYDFGFISKAVKVARKLHIPNLELVLWFDDLDQEPAAPFEKFLFGLSHDKHHVPRRRASRQPAPA